MYASFFSSRHSDLLPLLEKMFSSVVEELISLFSPLQFPVRLQ